MTEETKKLFDAPWTIEEEAPLAWYCVIDSKDSVVANDVRDQKTVNRLARLPELYGALMEAVYDACQDCLVERSFVDGKEEYDLIENGCVYPERDCCEQCRGWIELLRKEKNGEGVPETDKN